MELKNYIDVLVQAPIAVLLMYFMWSNFKALHKIIGDYKSIIEKLIDKT